MRRIDKPRSSKVITTPLSYKVRGKNKILADALATEQNHICAYTETYLGRSDKRDIDHFNPTLKGKATDSYENWFLVKAQWNSEKSTKWAKFQPVLHPTDPDFEKRIIYFEGEYATGNSEDIAATNLISILKLDDPNLLRERRAYLKRIKETISFSGKTNQKFVDDLLMTDPNDLYFIRALQEELQVKVNFDLLKQI